MFWHISPCSPGLLQQNIIFRMQVPNILKGEALSPQQLIHSSPKEVHVDGRYLMV